MDERDFRERLALIPCVRGLSSLPRELSAEAERDAALGRIVEERVRLDLLLDVLEDGALEEEPAPRVPAPSTFTKDVVEAAFRGDRTAGRHLVSWPAKLAAAAGIAAILAVGLLLRQERGAGPRTADDPEMIARLDLFLDDWEDVLEHEDALDLLASLEVAEALDAFPEDSSGPGEDGPR